MQKRIWKAISAMALVVLISNSIPFYSSAAEIEMNGGIETDTEIEKEESILDEELEDNDFILDELYEKKDLMINKGENEEEETVLEDEKGSEEETEAEIEEEESNDPDSVPLEMIETTEPSGMEWDEVEEKAEGAKEVDEEEQETGAAKEETGVYEYVVNEAAKTDEGTLINGEYRGFPWTLNTESGVLSIDGEGEINSFIGPIGTYTEKIVTIRLGASITGVPECWGSIYTEDIPTVFLQYELDEGNSTFSVQDGLLYSRDGSILISCPNGKTGTIYVPDYVKEIGRGAFYGTVNDIHVILGSQVKTIGFRAFSCPRMLSISFNKGLEVIEESAFENCLSLEEVDIPESVQKIGAYAFQGCQKREGLPFSKGLKKITVRGSGTKMWLNSGEVSMGGIFNDCTELEEAYLYCDVGDSCFVGCEKLKHVTLYEGVECIRYGAFDGTALEELSLPASIREVDGGSFYNCLKLTHIEIAKGNTFFEVKGDTLYSDGGKTLLFHMPAKSTMETFSVDNTVTRIGNYAFFQNIYSKIELPYGLKEIGASAFAGCPHLEKLVFPDTTEKIGECFADNCQELQYVVIPEKVADFGNYNMGTSVFQHFPDNALVYSYGNANGFVSNEREKSLQDGVIVSFEANGGNVATKEIKAFTTKQYGILPEPERQGFTFLGWYDSQHEGNKVNEQDWVKEVKDHALYARWEGKTAPATEGGSGSASKTQTIYTYQIAFQGNGATSGKIANLKCESGTDYFLPVNVYKRKGYTFTGWGINKNGSIKQYKEREKIRNLGSKEGDIITLYAIWTPIKYKITYKIYGGKNHSGNPSVYNIATNTIKLKKPTRKGYTFMGWYTKSSFKSKITTIKKGSTGNKTIYAKWKIIKYKITHTSQPNIRRIVHIFSL